MTIRRANKPKDRLDELEDWELVAELLRYRRERGIRSATRARDLSREQLLEALRAVGGFDEDLDR